MFVYIYARGYGIYVVLIYYYCRRELYLRAFGHTAEKTILDRFVTVNTTSAAVKPLRAKTMTFVSCYKWYCAVHYNSVQGVSETNEETIIRQKFNHQWCGGISKQLCFSKKILSKQTNHDFILTFEFITK